MSNYTRVLDLLPYFENKFGNKEDVLACKVDGIWKKWSISDFKNMANKVSKSLIALGLESQDKIAIISNNRPEWNFIDFGIQQIGAVSVPMYPTITEEDYRYIFQDAGVKIVFVSSEEIFLKARNAASSNFTIQQIYSFDEVDGSASFDSFLALGKNIADELVQQKSANVKPEDLLTLIYTSGTTGSPKGVMLTHNNLVSNVKTCNPLIPVDEKSRSLSFLPLCHIYERMLNYLYLSAGISIYYAESLDNVGANMKEVQPHLFVTVPRLLEKVYDKIMAKGMELTGIKRALFFWAVNLGLKYELNTNLGAFYNFQLWLANRLIFNKWREALGGNVRLIVSGGAPLQPRLARIFSAAQIVVMEGYGLTETSPVIAVNRYEEKERRIGSVGPIIQGVEVKIAEDGEILSRGPHIMKGYYNRPDLTAEVIDTDGWFHTGDIGEFIEGRFLKITDRKKEIFKTSGGKYIAPQVIENLLKESVVIEQAFVVGAGEKFPAALLVPFFPSLKEWCQHKGISYTTNTEMVNHPEVKEKFSREVETANQKLAQYEKIKKFYVVSEGWGIDSGELTPTLKLKRKVLNQKYEHVIKSFYEN